LGNYSADQGYLGTLRRAWDLSLSTPSLCQRGEINRVIPKKSTASSQNLQHYADTGGYTDQVFSTCHLLGFRFGPRLRDLGDRKLYTVEKPSSYPDLNLLIGGAVSVKQITEHWDELLRLTASLRLGTVTASLMLRKLASYPRQNGLAWALREVGRIEKTLFTLEWLQSVELRRRV
jgi:TnpA family transposase